MKFYRSLNTIKAISFDLDDTLYSNRPVMVATEAAMPGFFQQLLSGQKLSEQKFADFPKAQAITFDKHFWREFRITAYRSNQALGDDVTALRLATYTAGIESLGATREQAVKLAEQAMAFFITKRCDFTVPAASIELLSTLRQHMPVVAISNGNVDTKAIGLDQHFDFIYHAGNGMAKKPAGDLFAKASQDLALPAQHILHVGDCGYADIVGALRAGFQAAWLSCYDIGKPIRVLPHIELSEVTQLSRLVTQSST